MKHILLENPEIALSLSVAAVGHTAPLIQWLLNVKAAIKY
jgi:hypothetical protein